MSGTLLLAATRTMREYVENVEYHIKTFPDFYRHGQDTELMIPLRTIKFADGEMEVYADRSLRGGNVFLFARASRNEKEIDVQENQMELYHCIDVLKRAQAARITLFEPYCSSSRSDRPTRRNSVGLWVHYKILASLGVNHIITYQMHSEISRTIADPSICAIDDIPASVLVMEYITDNFIHSQEELDGEVRDSWVFCSVDAGSEKVARNFAHAFGTPLVVAHKVRNYNEANTIQSISLLTGTDLKGKTVWIVDDMIDTAGSIYALVKELIKHDVKTIRIATTHPVFSDPAVNRLLELFNEGHIECLIAADTVECTQKLQDKLPFLHVVSSAKFSAELVMCQHEGQSLTPFFEDFDAKKHLIRANFAN